MATIVTDPPQAPQSAEAERERCSAILSIAAFARRREIPVDVSTAIRTGARASDVRAAVLGVESDRDEASVITAHVVPPSVADSPTAKQERVRAAFRRGHRKGAGR